MSLFVHLGYEIDEKCEKHNCNMLLNLNGQKWCNECMKEEIESHTLTPTTGIITVDCSGWKTDA